MLIHACCYESVMENLCQKLKTELKVLDSNKVYFRFIVLNLMLTSEMLPVFRFFQSGTSQTFSYTYTVKPSHTPHILEHKQYHPQTLSLPQLVSSSFSGKRK